MTGDGFNSSKLSLECGLITIYAEECSGGLCLNATEPMLDSGLITFYAEQITGVQSNLNHAYLFMHRESGKKSHGFLAYIFIRRVAWQRD